MPAKSINPLDMATRQYEYIKYAMAVDHMIPWIKEQIKNSDDKFIVILLEDLTKDMGIGFEEKNFPVLYSHLKFIMLVHGIVMNSGIHKSGKRTLTLRMVSYKDKMPKYWKKRARLLKKLMKSTVWENMIEKRKKGNEKGD